MANWARTLNISSEWKEAQDNKITCKELANRIVIKLKLFKIENDYELESIIEDFEMMDDDISGDDFDYVMQNLYDWADTPLDDNWNGKKNCWVKTFE